MAMRNCSSKSVMFDVASVDESLSALWNPFFSPAAIASSVRPSVNDTVVSVWCSRRSVATSSTFSAPFSTAFPSPAASIGSRIPSLYSAVHFFTGSSLMWSDLPSALFSTSPYVVYVPRASAGVIVPLKPRYHGAIGSGASSSIIRRRFCTISRGL